MINSFLQKFTLLSPTDKQKLAESEVKQAQTPQSLERLKSKLKKLSSSFPENIVLSFPKSGKTWLSYLYVYYELYRLIGEQAEDFIDRNFKFNYTPETSKVFLKIIAKQKLSPETLAWGEQNPEEFRYFLSIQPNLSSAPIVQFKHIFHKEGDIPYFNLQIKFERINSDSSVLFLARDPRDIVVSYFHHVKAKKSVPLAEDVDISEFIRSESLGIRSIVAYMNQMMVQAPKMYNKFDILYYEDIVDDTITNFYRFLSFFRADKLDSSAIKKAIEQASFQSLQEKEKKKKSKNLLENQAVDPNILRFRRGQTGSYKTELNQDDIAFLDRVIINHLTPELDRYRQLSTQD